MNYVQCDLHNKNTNVNSTTWIPEKFAKQDMTLDIKDDNGNWESGWKVKAVYGKADEKQVIEMRDRHKEHRKGTDV